MRPVASLPGLPAIVREKGKAAFTVTAGASAGIPCEPGCFFNVVTQTASTGAMILNMR